jgi:hypothetical protein
LLDHLIGVRQVLAGGQARPSLCDAGLFHSVYGDAGVDLDLTPLPGARADVC